MNKQILSSLPPRGSEYLSHYSFEHSVSILQNLRYIYSLQVFPGFCENEPGVFKHSSAK